MKFFHFIKNIIIKKNKKGDALILVMTFMTIFLVMIGGMLGWITWQNKINLQQVAFEKAIQVAEAGANYYRWHLAHDPDDFLDLPYGQGYVHDYQDPYGGIVGHFTLEITPPAQNDTIVTIQSTGWVNDYPTMKRIVKAKYGIPSIASYSFISNSNVWFGPSEHIVGEMHSNGGIRQDGTNDSRVTSAKETYVCGPEHGCASETKPGIWGTGGPQNLWDFPVSNIDFNELTTDLVDLEDLAIADGFHLEESGESGYHLQFLADGTFNVYLVNETWASWGWDFSDGWTWRYIDINTETPLEPFNYPLPENGIIFIEDNVWVDGTVNGRVTLAAAKFPDTAETNKSIYINNNINYLTKDGIHALGLIAQKDVLIPFYSPMILNIDAVLTAQKGHCFRYYYPDNILTNITVYGSIITNTVWTWNWDCGGWICSGFQTTNSVYDPYLTYSPPPSFPTTGEYQFISWEELPL